MSPEPTAPNLLLPLLPILLIFVWSWRECIKDNKRMAARARARRHHYTWH